MAALAPPTGSAGTQSGSLPPQKLPSNGTVVLEVEEGGIEVPSFLGKNLRSAIEVAQDVGLDLDAVGSGVGEVQCGGVDQLFRLGGERYEERTDHCGCGEQRAQEQEATSEKYRGKETVLKLTKAVAQHTYEPQEGNTGERDQIQSKRNSLRVLAEPRPCVLGVGRHRNPKQPERGTVSRENSMPAMAAALGVLRFVRVRVAFCILASRERWQITRIGSSLPTDR